MNKKMKKLIDKYMYDYMTNDNDNKSQERYYTYGYIDGYFSEHIYIKQFFIDINEFHKHEYNIGFMDGVREKINLNNASEFKKEKEEFFKKLAVYDVVTKVDRKVLSSEKKYGVYHYYKKQVEDVIINETQYKRSNGKSKTRKNKDKTI